MEIECRELGALLGGLIDQQLALIGDQRRVRISRRVEFGYRVARTAQPGAEPGNVGLGGDEVAVQMLLFGAVHGRVELDQEIAGVDMLAVDHMDRPDNAGVERLDNLAAAAGHDLTLRRGDDVDCPPRSPGDC